MCKRLLLSALAVAFSAGAFLGIAGPSDWGWSVPGADSGNVQADWGWSVPGADSGNVQADWGWSMAPVDPEGHKAEAGAEA